MIRFVNLSVRFVSVKLSVPHHDCASFIRCFNCNVISFLEVDKGSSFILSEVRFVDCLNLRLRISFKHLCIQLSTSGCVSCGGFLWLSDRNKVLNISSLGLT